MTKWFSCLHLVVLLPFLFLVFIVLFFWVFFIPLQKTPKKPDTATTPKSKNAEKKGQIKNQLAQLGSQIVFLNFLWWAKKLQFFAESTIKIVVSASFVKGKMAPKCQKGWVKTWSKVESKLGPSMFATKLDQVLTQQMVSFIFFFVHFFENLILPAEEEYFETKKQKQKKNWTKFCLKKGYFWTKFWLYNIYIYIYIPLGRKLLHTKIVLILWGTPLHCVCHIK